MLYLCDINDKGYGIKDTDDNKVEFVMPDKAVSLAKHLKIYGVSTGGWESFILRFKGSFNLKEALFKGNYDTHFIASRLLGAGLDAGFAISSEEKPVLRVKRVKMYRFSVNGKYLDAEETAKLIADYCANNTIIDIAE